MSAPELTVVLPTLNEGKALRALLPRLEEAFRRLGVRGEVLVVDGGSSDDTQAVAREHGARVQLQRGRGYGSALREGLADASAPYALVMDADGSHPPEVLGELWARRDEADLVVGSRYVPGGSAAMPMSRQLLSRALNRVTCRVLDLEVMDSSSGFRLYRREMLAGLGSEATDFTVQQDLLARLLARGARVVEVPFRYEPRLAGASKASALRLAPAYLRMYARLKPLRDGWRSEAGLAWVMSIALLTGLCGITGGLPGPERLRSLPEAARRDPALARTLVDSWHRLYEGIRRSHEDSAAEEPVTYVRGMDEIAPGWTSPPDPLLNATRALLTQSVNPDEKKAYIVLAQMRPWRFEFKPLYAVYGGSFVYPLGAALGAAHLLGAARLVPDLAFYLADPAAMARLYLVGRLFVLFFHLLGVWSLYECGRLLGGRRAGTFAATLFALSPLVIAQSHVVKPHPVAAFWAVAAAWASVRAARLGRPADYVIGGACAGLAGGAALTTGIVAGLPALAWLSRRDGGWRWVLAGAAASLGTYAASNPHVILSPRDFAWELVGYMPTPSSLQPSAVLGGFAALPRGLGPMAAGLLAAACLRACFSRDGARRALGMLVVGGFVVIWLRFPYCADAVGTLRFAYPLVALGLLLGADALASLRAPALAAVLAASVLVDTGVRGALVLSDLHREAGATSTRVLAADWIDTNIPTGDSVGLVRYPEPAHTPPFRWDRVRLVVFDKPESLGGIEPAWMVLSESAQASLGAWLSERYETAASFPSSSLLGLRVQDDAFFANAGMKVLRRKGTGS